MGNEKKSQYWGDQFNAPLRDLLEDTCRSRVVSLVISCCVGYLKGSYNCIFVSFLFLFIVRIFTTSIVLTPVHVYTLMLAQ